MQPYIKYIVIIIIILALAYFSQQPYSQDIIKNVLSYVNKYAGASLIGGYNQNTAGDNSSSEQSASSTSGNTVDNNNANPYQLTGDSYSSLSTKTYAPEAENLTISSFAQKVVEGIKSGGETLANNINNTTEKISENISTAKENVQNYFTGISDAVQNKSSSSASCQCPTTQTSSNP